MIYCGFHWRSFYLVYKLYTKFAKILEICKKHSENLVNESENKNKKFGKAFSQKFTTTVQQNVLSLYLSHSYAPSELAVGF